MHILKLTHTYPNAFDKVQGVFVEDQVKSLRKFLDKVGVIAVIPISLKKFKLKKRLHSGNGSTLEDELTIIYTYYNIPSYPKYCVNVSLSKGYSIFLDYIAKHGLPDIIHVHRYESAALAIKIRDNYQIPYVITEHSSFFLRQVLPKTMTNVAKNAFLQSSCNIAVSEAFANVLNKKYGVNFNYIPNSVDTDFFSLKPRHKDRSSSVVFFNVASLNKNKNHELMIRSFADFNQKVKDSKLIIAGDGELKNELNQLIVDLGLANNVFLVGRLSRSEILSQLHHCDVFLLSSTFETFGIVLIEALSTGTPVLSTKCGGAESIVIHSVGVLVNSTLEEYSTELAKMYKKNEGLSNEYNAENIRAYAISNFSEEIVAKKLIGVYKKVVDL